MCAPVLEHDVPKRKRVLTLISEIEASAAAEAQQPKSPEKKTCLNSRLNGR
jgi:hypothetical protein